MKTTVEILAFASLMMFIACEGMIDRGINSLKDPRRPDINIKQGGRTILSGTGVADEIVGVSPTEKSSVEFIIENTGTSTLTLTGAPFVSIGGDGAADFPSELVVQPAATVIEAGRNEIFKITFAPIDIGQKTVTVSIESDDEDEPVYTFTLTGNTNPRCDFNATVRRGISKLMVQFEDTTVGDVNSWRWDFDGDGTIDSTSENPAYTYSSPGTYTTVLRVRGPGGSDIKSKVNYITVVMPEESAIEGAADGVLSMAVGDMNGDGASDIAYADGTGLYYRPNLGNGAFDARSLLEARSDLVAVGIADLDGVNGKDIIHLSGTEMSIWFNQGSGTYGSKSTISHTFIDALGVFAHRIDSDQDMDLVTWGYVDEGLVFWPNNGSGNFSTRIQVKETSQVVWAYLCAIPADIDGDGDADIVASYSGTPGHVQWYENADGSGSTWVRHIFDDAFPGAKTLAAIDLDNDGDLDIAAVSDERPDETFIYGRKIVWWENTDGHGLFGSKNIFDESFAIPISLKAKDFDEDGDDDLIAAGDSMILLFENDGSGGFTKHLITYTLPGALDAVAVDLDDDGDLDITGAGAQKIAGYRIALDGWYATTITTGFLRASSVCTSDINGDGIMDILATARGGGNPYIADGLVAWWKGYGNGNFATTPYPIMCNLNNAIQVLAADFNGDGFMDVLSTGDYYYGMILNLNEGGSGESWEKIVVSNASSFGLSGIADLDGDGVLDVLEAQYGSGPVYWRENTDGTGTAWEGHSIASASSPVAITAADIKGDLDLFPDIVVANYSGYLYWFENDGVPEDDGLFPNASLQYPAGCRHVIDNGTSSGYKSLFPIDIDKDGDVDVLTAAGGSTDEISLWINNGGGVFAAKQVIESGFDGASSVCAADIDGDGRIDIAATASGANMIAWWEQGANTGEWTRHVISDNFTGASFVHVADIDGDGDNDILATAAGDNKVVVFENNLAR
jgi:PKD repeat protein